MSEDDKSSSIWNILQEHCHAKGFSVFEHITVTSTILDDLSQPLPQVTCKPGEGNITAGILDQATLTDLNGKTHKVGSITHKSI